MKNLIAILVMYVALSSNSVEAKSNYTLRVGLPLDLVSAEYTGVPDNYKVFCTYKVDNKSVEVNKSLADKVFFLTKHNQHCPLTSWHYSDD